MRHTPDTSETPATSAAPGRRPCPDHWYGADPWYGAVDLGLDIEARYRPDVAGPLPNAPCRAPHGRRPPVRLTRRGRRALATGMAAVVVTGLVLVADGLAGGDGPPQPAAAAAPAAPAAPARQQSTPGTGSASRGRPPSVPPTRTPTPRAPVRALGFSPPTRIRIPSIGVDAPLTRVGLDGRGEIDTPPPEKKNLAAWYRNSSSPGADGTSVIVGHVDNMSGPSVFFSLGALKKGKLVEVPRQDGATAVFSVYGVEVVPRKDFPAERVYGDTGHPDLRVITCGGGYSRATGYTANVVVFARLLRTA
jgi:hypothetical protein